MESAKGTSQFEPTSDLLRYGAYMRELRKRSGLSLREVAEAAGVDKNTLLRLEAGLPVRKSSRSSICRVYGVLDLEPGHPPAKRVGEVSGNSIPGGMVWYRSRLPDPDAPSIIDTTPAYADEAERRRQGTLGLANQFFARLECDFPGARMRAGIFEVYGPSGMSSQPSGEAVVYVLRGSIRFLVGEEDYIVNPGGATCFNRTVPHLHEPAPSMQKSDLPAVMLYVQND